MIRCETMYLLCAVNIVVIDRNDLFSCHFFCSPFDVSYQSSQSIINLMFYLLKCLLLLYVVVSIMLCYEINKFWNLRLFHYFIINIKIFDLNYQNFSKINSFCQKIISYRIISNSNIIKRNFNSDGISIHVLNSRNGMLFQLLLKLFLINTNFNYHINVCISVLK